jgi:hypothetical protein
MGMAVNMSRHEFMMLALEFAREFDVVGCEIYYCNSYLYVFEIGKHGKLIASLEYADFSY